MVSHSGCVWATGHAMSGMKWENGVAPTPTTALTRWQNCVEWTDDDHLAIEAPSGSRDANALDDRLQTHCPKRAPLVGASSSTEMPQHRTMLANAVSVRRDAPQRHLSTGHECCRKLSPPSYRLFRRLSHGSRGLDRGEAQGPEAARTAGVLAEGCGDDRHREQGAGGDQRGGVRGDAAGDGGDCRRHPQRGGLPAHYGGDMVAVERPGTLLASGVQSVGSAAVPGAPRLAAGFGRGAHRRAPLAGAAGISRAKLVVEIVTDPRRFEEEQQRSLVMRQKMSASVGSTAMGIPAYASYAGSGGGAYAPNAPYAASFGGFAGFEPRASSLEAERRGSLA
eukprot:ctg_377.g229